MKIKLNEHITDFAGEPIEGLSVGDAIINSLMTMLKGEENMDGKAKFELFALASKLHGKEEVDLSLDEAAKIKDRVGRIYTPLIVGRLWNVLDPSPLT